MGFIAKDTGGDGNFKRVPQGLFIGRCYQLIDLGTQHTTGQYGDKQQHRIRIGWELFGEDDNGEPLTVVVAGKVVPMTISKNYTVSLHEKAGLRRDLSSWRGRNFSDDEARGFDIARLLGAYCMINVTHSDTNGKVYANVAGLTPLPGQLKNAKPDPVHDNMVFDLDKPDMAVFSSLHERLQDQIKLSPEWERFSRHGATQVEPSCQAEDEEIPF